jgi:hypothetical protein
MRFEATSFSVLVLNAKGRELRPNRLYQPPLRVFKSFLVLNLSICSKPS